MAADTDLNGYDGAFILAQLVELLLHVAEDHGAGRHADT